VHDSRVGFDDFVASRGQALLRFAYLLTHDGPLAEDLVQDALVKAHSRWNRQTRIEHPDAYVRRIVVNEFVTWRRRRSSSEVPSAQPPEAGPASGVPDAIEGIADRDVVWRLLAELPRNHRAVLVLRYYEGLSDAEIATVLGCPEGTVRSWASRALASLRTQPTLTDLPTLEDKA
jgi:RNA polymerase sigma-70 factor (sigma-E family)